MWYKHSQPSVASKQCLLDQSLHQELQCSAVPAAAAAAAAAAQA